VTPEKWILGLSSIRAKQQGLFCLQFLLIYTEKTIKTTLIAGLAQVGGKNEGGRGGEGMQKRPAAESGSLILE
jgi:hypothetical protein